VIVTDHSQFDYQQVVDNASIVVDTRHATARTRRGSARIVTLSSHPLPEQGTGYRLPSSTRGQGVTA